ncbi:CysZ protein [Mesoflavibacter sabulilitoris]|uniref:Coproporphyrinogen III oxidase n=1 Tax=Mesoflavibacter zeaxanthinifaciens subsp. sabulilitoris TaxID=1520893 RepID=A0A2T1N6K9_9FLAO|nr:EI24 domain-containing protein [Mesoflavibacter zeaxanthinifaciens]MBB3123255.1 CysZ protein [Mesoflavibacter zeaxanthinifaciens subsp. sabulilitoris]PSG87110.1 coproporphyrinogen III oxidase [Mesoflavibacter zeaxanthinifaciens subsp. sabulilitoris]
MIKHILQGLQGYAGAFGLISKLKLWKYFFIPIIISFVTAVIISISAYGLSDNIGNFIAKIWFWDWGKETFTTVSSFIGGFVVVALGLILYRHIIMALSAPFMSPVSEKIEAHLTGIQKHQHRNTSFSEQLSRGIKINLRNLTRELLLTIPILLISFIPVIGIVSSILLFLTQAYYAGFGNMDYTLERHFKYNESISFVRRYRGIAIGNGIVFMLLLLIPIFGIILVLPLSVTAASLKTVQVINAEKLSH